MNKSYRIQITGKVQGVWYRASAKDKALELGLKGKIWNEKDGSVGAIVQGNEELISEFIEWCKDGPPLSRVENVIVEEIDPAIDFQGFEIARSQ